MTFGQRLPVPLLVGLSFAILELFFFLGTGLHRAPSRDYAPAMNGDRCPLERPNGYECLLGKICRLPASCVQGVDAGFCCEKRDISPRAGYRQKTIK